MGSTSALWVRQQFGLAEQVPLSTAGANKAANVGRRPTLHILPRCEAPFELRCTAYKLHPGCIKTGAEWVLSGCRVGV